MSASDVDRGDALHPGHPVIVDRYTPAVRANHWVAAACLILLALSGLSMFHPSLFFLSALFGGGQWTRTIHPWIGVVLFFSFAGLFVRWVRLNLWRREDTRWLMGLSDVVTAHEERLPEVGKYNAGQKLVFWAMSVLISVLIVTGLVIWDQYFLSYTGIPTKRAALLIHSIASTVIILVAIVHVFAAFWVKGSVNAMTRGTVTGGWAWRHHRRWLRALAARSGEDLKGPTRAG
jgi:formate dehydrogenase subunit gamma